MSLVQSSLLRTLRPKSNPTPSDGETQGAIPFPTHRSPNAKSKSSGTSPSRLFFDFVKLLPKDLVHGKHVYLILFEYGVHPLVASDLTLIFWDLQVPLFDVLPDFLDHLRSRELAIGDQHMNLQG